MRRWWLDEDVGYLADVSIGRRAEGLGDMESARYPAASASPGTGRRLAPKGGKLSQSGRSMRFAGGYAEYKRLSRGSGALPATGYAAAAVGPSSEVDLLLSGQLRRSIEVAQADEDSAVVQTGTQTATYAGAVNALRPFMGLAPGDRAQVEAVLTQAVLGAIARRRAR